jgi:hypothetical protein
MTAYPDLSPYEYSEHDPSRKTVNIGWLGVGSMFNVGDSEPEFRHALLELIAHGDVNLTRGWHRCEFCDAEPGIEVPFESAQQGRVFLGHAEVHVLGTDGVVYAAPTMVYHYVAEHGYLPPQQFIDAVSHAVTQLGRSRGM